MKRKTLAAAAAFLTAVFLTGCSQPYNFDISKYLTLGNYTGIEVSKTELAGELQKNIDKLLSDNAVENAVTDRAAKMDDTVNIDYVGKIDGVEFNGGSGTNYDLKLGSGAFIAGFEDGIVGKNIGDKFEVKVTFPADYSKNADLAGKDAVFNVTLNSIKEKVPPELTDAFIADKTDYETIDQYKEATSASLKQTYVWNKFIESCTVIEYPKSYVKKYYDMMIKGYENYARNYGYTLESFVSASSGQTIEEFLRQTADNAMKQVKQEMAMYSISRANNITVTEDDYKNEAEKYAKKLHSDSVSVMEKTYTKDTVKANMLMDKVMAYVTGLSVEVDK